MKVSQKLKTVFYIYYIEYLLFSNQYSSLLQQGLIDRQFAHDSISFLDFFVDLAKEMNWYPLEILERLLAFTQLLKEYAKTEEQKEEIHCIQTKICNHTWMDSTEVYRREYISRYATIGSSKDYQMIPKERLVLAIQNDFRYLNILLKEDTNLEECIGEDFLYFLNKLLCDYPEVIQDRKMQKKIMHILKESNFPKKEKYIQLFSDKTNYAILEGFDLKKVECFYTNCLINKLLYTKNIDEELKKIPLFYFYQESFLTSIETFIHDYKSAKEMSKRKIDNLRHILLYMRRNMQSFACDRHTTISIINEGLVLTNTIHSIDFDLNYLGEYRKRLEKYSYLETLLIFSSDYKRVEAIEHIEYLIALTPEVFDYLLKKRDRTSFTIRNPIYESEIDSTDYVEKDIVRVLAYLFKNYPRMFFDDTIYRQTMSLLESFPPLVQGKLKKKIYKIRRDN